MNYTCNKIKQIKASDFLFSKETFPVFVLDRPLLRQHLAWPNYDHFNLDNL